MPSTPSSCCCCFCFWCATPLWSFRERRAESRESRAGSRSRGSQSVDRGNMCSRETTGTRMDREEVKRSATRMGREEVKRSVKELDVKSTRRRGVPLPKLETTGYPPSGVGLLWPNAKCVPEQLCAELKIWNFVNNGIHKVIYAISVRNCLLCYQSMPFSGRSLKYMSHIWNINSNVFGWGIRPFARQFWDSTPIRLPDDK